MRDWWQDVRYGGRILRKNPGFAAVAILTLGLGIGANTAIFAVVNAILLRPLPYADAERLVALGESKDGSGRPGNVGFTTYADWKARSRSFDELALIRSWNPTLTGDGDPERIPGLRVTQNYFRMLGVRPAVGRDFLPEEDRPEQWRVVLLSDRLWRRRFNADRSIVGRSITMDGLPHLVVGILPADYEPLISAHFYRPAEIWAPLGYDTSLRYACRTCQHLKAVGRLQPETTIERAEAEMDTIQRTLVAEHPTEYNPEPFAVVSLRDEIVGPVQPALQVLVGAVGFVLLIACANVANLLLARATHRRREIAVRAAIGAGRLRLARQLLAESALLALIGGALGLLLGYWGRQALIALSPSSLPRTEAAPFDVWVLAFTAALSIITAAAFGVVPAIQASRADLQTTLQEGRQSAGPGHARVRGLLVVADVALALVLLAGAGLMIKSMANLLRVDPGFDPENVLTLQFSLVGPAYAEDAKVSLAIDEIVRAVQAVPGVEAAAAAGQIPFGGNMDTWGFRIEEKPLANPADAPSVERYSVTPDYFRIMSIPLRRGRLIDDTDRRETQLVVLIGETTARTLWPGEDPLGKRIRIGGPDGPWRTIVGIVGDVRHYELDARPTMQMYLPQRQVTDSFLVLTVRTAVAAGSVGNAVRQAIWEIAPDAPIYDVAPLTELVNRSLARRRFVMVLLGLFAGVALLMAAVGIYGVVAYTVAERTREVGIRVALGAQRVDIVRLVLREGVALIALGTAAGLLAAAGLTRILTGMLFDVTPTDPLTLAAIVVVLVAVAAAAHILPARRALRIDPIVALRTE